MKKIQLKGGSLSGTYLCMPNNGNLFVRKEVSVSINREYGYQRWYSQLKRLQRYSVLFPNLFPNIIQYGMVDDIAFFDMEYFEDSITVSDFLLMASNTSQVDNLLMKLLAELQKLYALKIPSTSLSVDLYIFEEIEQKINACKENKRFQEFSKDGTTIFNGVKVPLLEFEINNYRSIFKNAYKSPYETFTHGNLTLENILFQPKNERIIFIDPYEENIIDSPLADYSQLLQSSNSKYEIVNSTPFEISGNIVNIKLPNTNFLDYFNMQLIDILKKQYNSNDFKVIQLLEISQYARMLPFKMAIDEEKMLLFYALGSYLFYNFQTAFKKICQ